MTCIFCNIVEKKTSTKIIFEDEDLIVFDDIAPKAPTHILIIPKKHIASLNETQKEDLTLLGKLMHKAKELAYELHHHQGFRVVMNTGDDGGQTVHHIHLHLLAGRQMTWPPG
jgi:histidine triad (HIT) family protein